MTIEATTDRCIHGNQCGDCEECANIIAAIPPRHGLMAGTAIGIAHYKVISGRAKVYDENCEQIASADSIADAERIVKALRRDAAFDALVDALQQAHTAATVQFHGDIKKESARVVAIIESALKLATAKD